MDRSSERDEQWVKTQLDLFFRDGNFNQLDRILNTPVLLEALQNKRFMKQGQPTMHPIEFCVRRGLLDEDALHQVIDVFDQQCPWEEVLSSAEQARDDIIFRLLWGYAKHKKLDTTQLFLQCVNREFMGGIECLAPAQHAWIVLDKCEWLMDLEEPECINMISCILECRTDWMELFQILRDRASTQTQLKNYTHLVMNWVPDFESRINKTLLLDHVDPNTVDRQRPKRM